MLVLARKLDEVIHIGNNIKIKIVALQPGLVKLGIDAPTDMPIIRQELIPKMKFDHRAQQARLGGKKSHGG